MTDLPPSVIRVTDPNDQGCYRYFLNADRAFEFRYFVDVENKGVNYEARVEEKRKEVEEKRKEVEECGDEKRNRAELQVVR